MKSHQVVRVNLSPYQRPDFIRLEKAQLEALPNITYKNIDEVNRDQATVLITNTHTDLRALPQFLLDQTVLVLHPNSGYDHFRPDHDIWSKMPVVIGHEVRAQAVAEYTLGCLFEGRLELPQHLAWHKERTWERRLLKGDSVLVFGYGHIGKIVADTLALIGMDVTVVDPFIIHCPHRLIKTWRETDLAKARNVIVCCSLNSSSKKIFDHEFFAKAHEELLFINGARGGVVNGQALKEFLLTHPRALAFLDVFENEPFGEEWHHFPQVWKTSHIAGVHQDLDQAILDFEKKVLKDFLHLGTADFQSKYKTELLQSKWKEGELI